MQNTNTHVSTPRGKVLVVDSDADARESVALAFECEGYQVEAVENEHEGLEIIANRRSEFSAVLIDLSTSCLGGADALRQMHRITPDLPIIVTSSAAAPGNVVDAMRAGATNFLVKPLNQQDLQDLMLQILPPDAVEDASPDAAGNLTFWGCSPAMRGIQAAIRRISHSEAPVLIEGETGSGKEVLAREIHAHSRRAGRPFLKLNCAAMPSELVESELFGYERGAFTGAFQRKAGMFDLADRGTILLDEIGDMDFKLQAKLLQVLQDSEYQRLGGKETVRVDVRVMAATHRDLHAAIHNETFRADLYYRLNVINLHVPPLRERKEDIIPLVHRFLQKHASSGPKPALLPVLQQAMMQYSWPGNVRELENLIRRFLALGDAVEVTRELERRAARASDLGESVGSGRPARIHPTTPNRARASDIVGTGAREISAADRAIEPNGLSVAGDPAEISPRAAWPTTGAASPASAAIRRAPSTSMPGEGIADDFAGPASRVTSESPVGRSVLLEFTRAKEHAEAAAILQALQSTHWNRKRAAQLLNIDYKKLLYKMKKLSIGVGC